MPRLRKSQEELELSGAFLKSQRSRRAPDPKSTGPFGRHPKEFTQEEMDCWNELILIHIPGVMTAADRWIAEVACRLMAKQRSGYISTAELSQLLNCIGKMGMSPLDRMKLAPPLNPDQKTTTAFDEFLN